MSIRCQCSINGQVSCVISVVSMSVSSGKFNKRNDLPNHMLCLVVSSPVSLLFWLQGL